MTAHSIVKEKKQVVCLNRDCSQVFYPNKRQKKFCCKKCYFKERNHRINDCNRKIKKEKIERERLLDIERRKYLKIETKQEKRERISGEKAKLRNEVIEYFGEPIGSYSVNEIAEFFGATKASIQRTMTIAIKKIRADSDFAEACYC